jgi:signal transduction histidine kinase
MRRPLLPDTVLGRTALVLVAALLVAVAAAVAVFAFQRQEALARYAAERVSGLVKIAEQTAPDRRRHTLHHLDTPRLHVGWAPVPIVAEGEAESDGRTEAAGLPVVIRNSLEKELEGREIRLSTAPPPLPRDGAGSAMGMGAGFRPPFHGLPPHGLVLRISVRLQDGSWLNIIAPLELSDSLWRPRFLLPLSLALLLVTTAALWAVRSSTRPFATFAAAAERLGVDVAAPPLAENGPREVRQAAHAFNVMQGRIARFVQGRTEMLAAISHDLKTPITRLRLRAEFIDDDEQRTKMLGDLEEMEAMIAATLAFARDDAAREPRVRVDMAALVQGLVDDTAALGAEASYSGPDSLVIEARPTALKRGLTNLIDNAVKYGTRARVALETTAGDTVITIDDDGPGIAEADRERVFAPFVRLETSRSRDTGGSGLGLAVARAAIRAHGGDIRLANRPEGGLRVTVALPQG